MNQQLNFFLLQKWIKENNVLEIVLADSMHQPQYVEKLEKILRFIIKEKALTIQDLDAIWAAQVGKHEAIVKNVHDLFAKLAWDFSSEQLDHLFERFQVRPYGNMSFIISSFFLSFLVKWNKLRLAIFTIVRRNWQNVMCSSLKSISERKS